ncbi:hypothetical protein NC652_039049 [Populus alba x Populus x berolinensis]|nr:hypothetical protein NC652_039049 [Populus alba x Populus x berolinensis]
MAVEDHRQNMLVWFDLLVYFGDRRAVFKSGCGVGTSYNIVECPDFGFDVITIRFLDNCLRDVESCMPYCLPLFEYMVIFIDTAVKTEALGRQLRSPIFALCAALMFTKLGIREINPSRLKKINNGCFPSRVSMPFLGRFPSTIKHWTGFIKAAIGFFSKQERNGV